ncbi:uncharacterized protein LOC100774220 [Cricetulus griseus]|uniref:uncharacterized protein LOC100774220 n=1 Tax=Cricetulus griseus TaxID=10029 RepID=UPI00045485BA|nr:uncharacterized protein LOC100774220 [Cricetulus griseus]
MSNERVTYAELNVAKHPRKQQRKPRGTRSSISATEQEITYAEFSFQNACQEHPPVCRDRCCKGFPFPPEKLITGILGIIDLALLVAVVVIRTVATPYPEANSQNSSSVTSTQKDLNNNLSSAHTCSHCPKEWISYAHNCYYIGAEKKTWNDSVESCVSKNSNLLHIDSEEEQEFLKLFSLVSWTGVFRESRNQLWIWKKDSTFKPKITEPSQDEHNCVMLSSSGFTADNCTALHAYLFIDQCFTQSSSENLLFASDENKYRDPQLDTVQKSAQHLPPDSRQGVTHLLRTEGGSGPRGAAKETQGHSQLHFSNPAGNQLMEFSLQNTSHSHLEINRHWHCRNILSPPEKLIAGILGIIWFALLVTLVITTSIVSPYIEPKGEIQTFLFTSQKGTHYLLSSAHSCGHWPKEWVSYSHSCYYIGVDKKTWNDSLVSCISKNSSLLYIDSEEEQEFLKLFSLVSWTGVFRENRNQLWIWKKDSTFKPRITEPSQDEHNCVMLSSSGFTADNCTALHAYLCKHKLTN